MPFGTPTPYAEPFWYSRNVTPHYGPSHRKLRAEVRRYMDEEIRPDAFEWETAGVVPEKVSEDLLLGSLECDDGWVRMVMGG